MVKLVSNISERELHDVELASVQNEAIALASNRPPDMLNAYNAKPGTFNGRYVCADTFKQLFPAFEQKDNRSKVNNAIHNSAAVLSATQFEEVIKRNEPDKDQAVFLTGIPGAGKTTTITNDGKLSDRTKIVFEGQLANPSSAIPKIQQCLDANLTVTIVAVHLDASKALVNTFTRFNEYGRGASIGIMSEIQGNLPQGLKQLKEHFGDKISISVMDRNNNNTLIHGDDEKAIEVLKSGTKDEIQNKLSTKIKQDWLAGKINDQCFLQAQGNANVWNNDMEQRVIILNKSHIVETNKGTDEEKKWVAETVTPAPDNMKSNVYNLKTAKAAETDKESIGQIIHKDDESVFQEVNKKLVKHDTKSFESTPKIGDVVKISYDNGKAITQDANQQTQGRSKTR